MASNTPTNGLLSAGLCMVLLVVLCYPLSAVSVNRDACHDVDVRVNIDNFEKLKNCSVINGYLQIVLFDKTNVTHFKNLSFPDLKEITGLLLIYRVQGLTSLGKLFPNLQRINGNQLFHNYALIIRNATDLYEIGLKNLISIENGEVHISQCPNLCYVNTVDWKSITQNVVYQYDGHPRTDCPPCPERCNGYCWNATFCQTCRGNTSKEECSADICVDYTDGKDCVKECPSNKIKLGYNCITKEDCKMKIYDDECVDKCPKFTEEMVDRNNKSYCKFCGENCKKICDEITVSTQGFLQKLEGCTEINGTLTLEGNAHEFKYLPKKNISALSYYMDQIRVITGSLRVHKTKGLENLHFLSKLERIGTNLAKLGDTDVISARDNENLNDLFLENVTRNLNLPEDGTVYFHFNPQLCLSKIENVLNATNKLMFLKETTMVSELSNGHEAACNIINMNVTVINITSTTITISWSEPGLNKYESLVGYFVYYSDQKLKRDSDRCEKVWSAANSANTNITLKHLVPYTNYSYYIMRFTNRTSGRSQTRTFSNRTLPDDPAPPINIKVKATNTSIIYLEWGRPPNSTQNGVLSHYQLYVVEEPDNIARIKSDRNYCNIAHGTKQTSRMFEMNSLNKCDCSGRIMTRFCYEEKVDGVELKNTCKKYNYRMLHEHHPITKRSNDFPAQTSMGFANNFTINASATNYTVENLKHFTMYVFYFTACNHPPDNSSQFGPEPNKTYCSAILMESARTKRNETADVIRDLKHRRIGSNNYLEWSDPIAPNQVIVSYTIDYNRTDVHIVHKPLCITDANLNITAGNRKRFLLPRLDPGSYSFEVLATSLAGKSKLGRRVTYEPESTDSNAIIWAPILSVLLFILGIAVSLYFYRRHLINHNKKNLLFRSVNPDYMGVQYEADDWEMDRENIEILKEMGQGTFGMVYSGFIKSQNIPCAVKTINDTSNVENKNDFLKEASVMKPLNGAHHVVKLLGVVSKGDPPYVVMELMARGDLKNYLRRSRESSHNITCVEMYKMAAEIADGMMYLTSKKFVHRDLATRNCMVSADHTVKVGDFGMARDIYETDYYRKETKGLLPVRWMAPESLADGLFTSDSDVWSYGVVLWEIANLAEQPYQGLGNEQVLQFIKGRGTLKRPQQCSDLLYEIMSACWKWKPYDRPTFEQIVEKLESHVGQDFRLVSFYHSRSGEEYRLNCGERVINQPALSKIPDSTGLDDYVHWDDDEQASLYTSSTRPKNSVSFTSHRSKSSSFF